MRINDKITIDGYHQELKKHAKVVILIIIMLILLELIALYSFSKPTKKETFSMWIGADFTLTTTVKEEIKQITGYYNIKKINIKNYSPSDEYYDAAFAMQKNDLYLLSSESLKKLTGLDFFLALDDKYQTNGYYENDLLIGAYLTTDYYLLINKDTDKDLKMLESIIDLIIEKKVHNEET